MFCHLSREWVVASFISSLVQICSLCWSTPCILKLVSSGFVVPCLVLVYLSIFSTSIGCGWWLPVTFLIQMCSPPCFISSIYTGSEWRLFWSYYWPPVFSLLCSTSFICSHRLWVVTSAALVIQILLTIMFHTYNFCRVWVVASLLHLCTMCSLLYFGLLICIESEWWNLLLYIV